MLPGAVYVDLQGPSGMHMLRSEPLMRAVTESASAEDPHHLGFSTYYVDSLGADGTSALHSDGGQVGIEWIADDERWAYAMRASAFHGYLFVCSVPSQRLADASLPYRAEATLRLQADAADWNVSDELRVWADVDGARQTSLLPGCADAATQGTIDLLGGSSGEWLTLSSPLGLPEATEQVRVCVGLQSAMAAAAATSRPSLFLSGLRLVSDERPRQSNAACPPSLGLTPVEQFGSLVYSPRAASGSSTDDGAGASPQGAAAPRQPRVATAGLGAMTTAIIVGGVVLAAGFFGVLGWVLTRSEAPYLASSSNGIFGAVGGRPSGSSTRRCTAVASVNSHDVEVVQVRDRWSASNEESQAKPV